jgi:hypothetical protein
LAAVRPVDLAPLRVDSHAFESAWSRAGDLEVPASAGVVEIGERDRVGVVAVVGSVDLSVCRVNRHAFRGVDGGAGGIEAAAAPRVVQIGEKDRVRIEAIGPVDRPRGKVHREAQRTSGVTPVVLTSPPLPRTQLR